MLLVRRGEGFPGAGEAFSGAGDGFPGTAVSGAAVVAETREAISCRLRAYWVVLAHRSGCGAASSKGAAISKYTPACGDGHGLPETSAKSQRAS